MVEERTEAIRKARRWQRFITAVPVCIVLALVLAAAILVVVDRWRRGAVVFSGALLVGAVLRACLPSTRAGLLQVRSRVFDVAFLGSLAGLVFWLATSIDALGTA